MEDNCTEVDPQKILTSCPVKMKPISSFFKKKTLHEGIQKVNGLSNDSEVPSKNDSVKSSPEKDKVVDVEMSYEDFLKDKNDQKDTENDTESKEGRENVMPEEVNNACSDSFTRLKDKSEDSEVVESMDTCNSSNIKLDSEENPVIIINWDNKDCTVSAKETDTVEEEKDCPPVVKATGKASILGYFKKSVKEKDSEEKPMQISPEVVITKVDVHTEPLKKSTNEDTGNVFSIFDSAKRKTGLESKTSPKTNVSVHNEDFDMGITVLESPVVETKDNENEAEDRVAMEAEDLNTPEDTEVSDGLETDEATETTVSATGAVKKTISRKVQRSGKGDKENSPHVKSSKKTLSGPNTKTPKNEKRSKKHGTARAPLDSLDSSQSDEFTPNSKVAFSGSGKKRTMKYCGKCSGCSIEDDCGKCVMCLDKKKFGGPNTKRQKCILRRCEKFFGSAKKDQKYDKAKELLQKAKNKKFSPGSPTKVSPKKGKKVLSVTRKQAQVPAKVSVKPQKGGRNQTSSQSGQRVSSPPSKKSRGSKTDTPTSGGQARSNPGSSGGAMKSKRRSAQAASKVLAEPSDESEMSSLDVTPCKKSLDFTPKRGKRNLKSETPTRRGRKVATKLAPIFKKTSQESADSDVEVLLTEEEKERHRIRQEFLRSGVPDEVRKQQQVIAAVQLSDYPPVPTVSHVLQIEEGDSVWTGDCLLKLELKDEDTLCTPEPHSSEEINLIDKTESDIDLSALTLFSGHPTIESEITKTLVAEINTSNPAYPAKRTYRQLMARKNAAKKGPCEIVTKETENSTTEDKKTENAFNKKKRKLSLDLQEPEAALPRRKRKRRKESTDSVMMLDEDKGDEGDDEGVEEDDSKRRLSLRRRSTRKSKTEEPIIPEVSEVKQESQPELQEKCDLNVCTRQLLWTDKYAPSNSREIVGNSRSVEKFRVWLQDWKKITDLEMKRLAKEMEKQAKKNKQQPVSGEKKVHTEWSDESDFEQDSDSGSDYMPESDWEIGLCNTMLITGPHGIGKTAMVQALAEELGYKVFEVNASGKRAGKQVLTQLQEATQSHQVSNRNLEDVFTTILSGDTTGAQAKPKEKPVPKKPEKKDLPTAFTNLFNKKKPQDAQSKLDMKVEKVASPRKGRTRKTAEDSPKKKTGKKAVEDSPKKKPGRQKRGASNDEVIIVKEQKSPIKKTQSRLISMMKDKPKPALTAPVTLPRQDSESAKRGLDLSSCSLILFEEVDLVFEEDKGFWAAIQTFMNTTKRPIVMTTSDRLFVHKFDPKGELKMETLHLRTPNLVNTATYLQLVLLAENLRSCFNDVLSLVEMCKGDIRRCVLMLQYWAESGGAVFPVQQDVLYQKTLLNKKAGQNVEEINGADAVSSVIPQPNHTTEVLNVDETANLPRGSIDTDDEFQLPKPRQHRNRKAFIIEDDSSMDSFRGSPVKLLQGMASNLENILEEDDSQASQNASLDLVGGMLQSSQGKTATDLCCCTWSPQYPLTHTGCTESCLCLNGTKAGSTASDDVAMLKKISYGYVKSTSDTVKHFLDYHLNIIYLNLVHLLPLPKELKPLYSFTKFQNEKYTVNHRLSRIKNRYDLFDSEMDSEPETDKTEQSDNQTSKGHTQGQIPKAQENSVQEKCKRREPSEEEKAVMSSIQILSDLYESFSFADSHLTLCKDKHEWLSPNLNNASLLPGLSDCGSICDVEGRNLWKHDYANEMLAHVELGNYSKTCDRLTQVMNKVSHLTDEERGDTEKKISLPVDAQKVKLMTHELSAVQSSLQDTYRSAIKNVFQEVNPKSRREGRCEFTGASFSTSQNAVAMEYMPALRTICKAEKFKEESKTKRRFLHYLESQHFSVKRSTTETLCTSFT